MQGLSHHEIVIFFLQISLMLTAGKLLGEIAKRLKQPAVIGEIMAGIILGPTIMGTLFPEMMISIFPVRGNSPVALHGLTSMSVVLLLFVAGLEVELRVVFSQGRKAVATSATGILLPFVLGFSVIYLIPDIFHIVDGRKFGTGFDQKLVTALFMGTALSISALPVIARTLMDLGMFKSNIGMLIIASAMIDDLLGWVCFSVVLGMMKPNVEHSLSFTIIATLSFVALMLTLGRRILDKLLPIVNRQVSYPGGILAFAITMGFLGASFTESIGIHAIFGSFVVGIALGDSIHLSRKTKELIHDFVSNIFAPLFFVSIGLKVNFIQNFQWQLVLIVLVLAFIGKTVGCGIGARMSGFTKNESLAIGFGMNARGAMEIILASIALQAGLIDQYVFVALVIMAIITSMSAGYFIRLFMPKSNLSQEKSSGFVILGDNDVANYFINFLQERKIPVLIADPNKKRPASRGELAVFHGDVTDRRVLEQLDLSRYSCMLALSENDEVNKKASDSFEAEFGKGFAFRLISKEESKSASLALSENILFRASHWTYQSVEKILKQDDLKLIDLKFDKPQTLDRFITFSNKKKTVLPLLIVKGKLYEPVSSFPIDIDANGVLLYIETPEQESAKPPKAPRPEASAVAS
jgi:Kef-type K+ transport system membrane component KefB